MRTASLAFIAALLLPAAAGAVDVTPHRAIYEMSLGKVQPSSGITRAEGRMEFEWGDSCDGWVVQQRYELHMTYESAGDTTLTISFVTWEAKDGLRYRYNVRKLRDGQPDEDLGGEATLPALTQPGQAKFSRPESQTIPLPAGALFPSGHTVAMIEAAMAGENFLAKQVFDGGTLAGPDQVTAAIGAAHAADAAESDPLLRKRWWPVRMAFFAADSTDSSSPDYELGMDLQEDGIARNMVLDYGNFSVRAKLIKLEKLPPQC